MTGLHVAMKKNLKVIIPFQKLQVKSSTTYIRVSLDICHFTLIQTSVHWFALAAHSNMQRLRYFDIFEFLNKLIIPCI